MGATLGLPASELMADRKLRYRWTARIGRGLRSPLEELPPRLRDLAIQGYRATLHDQGFDDPGGLQLEVAVRRIDEKLYAFEVTAPIEPDAWSMAATFNLMEAFDAMKGPVEDIDGRPRSACPPGSSRRTPRSADSRSTLEIHLAPERGHQLLRQLLDGPPLERPFSALTREAGLANLLEGGLGPGRRERKQHRAREEAVVPGCLEARVSALDLWFARGEPSRNGQGWGRAFPLEELTHASCFSRGVEHRVRWRRGPCRLHHRQRPGGELEPPVGHRLEDRGQLGSMLPEDLETSAHLAGGSLHGRGGDQWWR
jgi:hypothetical protein